MAWLEDYFDHAEQNSAPGARQLHTAPYLGPVPKLQFSPKINSFRAGTMRSYSLDMFRWIFTGLLKRGFVCVHTLCSFFMTPSSHKAVLPSSMCGCFYTHNTSPRWQRDLRWKSLVLQWTRRHSTQMGFSKAAQWARHLITIESQQKLSTWLIWVHLKIQHSGQVFAVTERCECSTRRHTWAGGSMGQPYPPGTLGTCYISHCPCCHGSTAIATCAR